MIDVTDLLIKSDDPQLVALFDEALDGFAVPIEQDDPRSGFELVKLSPGDPASIAAFENFPTQSHGYEVQVMPLIEIPSIPYDYANERPAKSLGSPNHDLRRSGARDLVWAGVPERIVMRIDA